MVFLSIFFAINWWQERHLLNHQSDNKAPHAQLVSIDGKNYQLPADKQNHLIYFFAPWCTICDLSIGNIEAHKQNLIDKGYQVYYVALSWQNQEEIQTFAKEHQLSFPVLLGTEQTGLDYSIKGFPTYYLINSQGQVVSGSQGYSTELGIWLRSFSD